jgi:hypothetical protein
VIHPTGDHDHRSYFHQNQEPAIRMERSTDFFRLNHFINPVTIYFPFRASSRPLIKAWLAEKGKTH